MDQIVIDTGAECFPVGTSATVFGPDGVRPRPSRTGSLGRDHPAHHRHRHRAARHEERRVTRRIVVVGGGENAEHDVSLATARAVAEGLRSTGFDVDELTIDRGESGGEARMRSGRRPSVP